MDVAHPMSRQWLLVCLVTSWMVHQMLPAHLVSFAEVAQGNSAFAVQWWSAEVIARAVVLPRTSVLCCRVGALPVQTRPPLERSQSLLPGWSIHRVRCQFAVVVTVSCPPFALAFAHIAGKA